MGLAAAGVVLLFAACPPPKAVAWGGPFSIGRYVNFLNPGVLPDGSLLEIAEVGAGDSAIDDDVIVLVAPDGTRRVVAGGRNRHDSSGDGGPATKAGLSAVYQTIGMPDGGFLIHDGDRLRRVDPAGFISTVANVENLLDFALLPDGIVVAANWDSNRIYAFTLPGSRKLVWQLPRRPNLGAGISATPDGSIIAQVGARRLLRRDASGTVSTVADIDAGGSAKSWLYGLAPAPDGGYVASAREPPRILRVAPDGSATVLVPPSVFRRLGKQPGDVYPLGLATLADGSLIVDTGAAGTLMFPSDHPPFPGVGVRRISRIASGFRVNVESTHAGTLRFRILRRGQSMVSRTLAINAGRTAIYVPRLRRARYRIRAEVLGQATHARVAMRLSVRRRSARAYF